MRQPALTDLWHTHTSYAGAGEWWAATWTHGARRPLEHLPPAIRRAFVTEVTARVAPLREPGGFHER